jgi:hypothetical protein
MSADAGGDPGRPGRELRLADELRTSCESQVRLEVEMTSLRGQFVRLLSANAASEHGVGPVNDGTNERIAYMILHADRSFGGQANLGNAIQFLILAHHHGVPRKSRIRFERHARKRFAPRKTILPNR